MTIHLSRNGQKFGPYTLVQVNLYLIDETVLPTDDAWAEGRDGWVPVTQFPGVIAPVTGPSESTPPPPLGALPPVIQQPHGFPATPDFGPQPFPVMPLVAARQKKRKVLIGVGALLGLAILIGVGLLVLDRANQAPEGEEFAKLHQAYKSKILPMEIKVIKLAIRLDDADDEDEELTLINAVNENILLRILALKTIDLNHHKIEELNEDYIKYCEKGQQMWSDVIRQYEIGNYRRGDEIIQKNLKRITDDLANWIKRFNRLCAKHGLPDLEAIMEDLAPGF